MKYRDRIQMKYDLILTFIFFVSALLLFTSSDFGKSLRNVNSDQVVHKEFLFTHIPPARTSLKMKEIKIFSPYKNFDTEDIHEKLLHWEFEYEKRSKSHHRELKDYIFQTVLDSNEKFPVIIDSGGHVGDTGVPVLKRLFENGLVDTQLVIIEPDFSKCLWIKRLAIDLNKTHPGFEKNVHIVNSGIWSHKSTASLIRDKMHAGRWYVKHDDYRRRDYEKEVKKTKFLEPFVQGEIQLLSISDIISPNANLFLWHLDAEGSESRALLGLTKLKQEPIIIFESFSTKNTDFLFNKDFLKYTKNYRMIKRLLPNQDRVMIPEKHWNEEYMSELPEYL